MTNANTPQPEGNNNSITITIDGQVHQLNVAQFACPDTGQQLVAIAREAGHILVHEWHQVLAAPRDVHRIFLDMYQSNPTVWLYQISGQHQSFGNPFDATLNCFVNQGDLDQIEAALALAILCAGIVCPSSATEASRRIREWQNRNGISCEPARTIAARIREQSERQENSQRQTPQEAARAVLRTIQADREPPGIDGAIPMVRYFQADFYVWDGTSWRVAPAFETAVARRLQQLPEYESVALTNNFIKSVITNIQALVYLDHLIARQPFRVENETTANLVERQILSFDNGIIDTERLHSNDGNIVVETHDPAVFGAPRLRYTFDAAAHAPLWHQTLLEIFPQASPHDHRIEVLQEFFGYCLLTGNHRFETFLILIGDGVNGKSVILEVLRGLLGRENVSNVPLDAFEAQFSKADMIGRLANIATDMQRMPRVQEGTLKQLVSGEPLQIDRKFKPATTAYPTAKLVFATNHLPPFADTTDGLWRRMVVIPFFMQFTEERVDRYRARTIVTDEISGIVNWALDGARRLLTQDSFTRCAVCDRAKSDHRHDSDPFRQFLDECCEIEATQSVLVDELYEAYMGFCRASGKFLKAKSELGKQLSRLAGVSRRRATQVGRRYYVYLGIGLLPTVLGTRVSSGDPLRRTYQPAFPMPIDTRPHRGRGENTSTNSDSVVPAYPHRGSESEDS